MSPEPLDLEPIKAREQAASDGPWEVRQFDADGSEGWSPEWVYVASPKGYNIAMSDGEQVAYEPMRCDAEFIAHARHDIPALIAEVERLRAGVAEIRAWHGEQHRRRVDGWRGIWVFMSIELDRMLNNLECKEPADVTTQ